MNKPVLPGSFARPAALGWVFLLPLVVLLLINLHACWLVGAEARWYWLAVLAYQTMLIGLTVAVWQRTLAKGKEISVKVSSLFLGGNIMHLFIMINALQTLVPSSIDPWILDGGDLMLAQFTFTMPGIFYGVTRLSCHKLELQMDQGKAALWFLGAIFLLPGLLLGSFLLFGHTYNLFTFVPFFVFVAVVLFFMHLFIRFVMVTYQALTQKGAWENSILRILMAASGPALISLLAKVFHIWTGPEQILLFLLVALNGILMILPPWKGSPWVGWGLFLRSVTYPVTVYFFLLVLPYLPLAVFAILALGIGFLAWIPVALFLLHTKSLVEDWQAAVTGLGRWRTVVVFSLGVLALPLYFTGGAIADKLVLKKALQFVYSSDPRGEVRFDGSARDVARTMRALRDYKQGDGFPYICDIYNAIVFEGMVLPDKKIEHVYKLFSGEELTPSADSWRGGFWGRGRASRRWRAAVDNKVDLVSALAKSRRDKGFISSTLSLDVAWTPEAKENGKDKRWRGGSWQREFVRSFDLPPGVLITGFRLKIGNELVPGKVFEKKTALWVYEQIRDTRRDPGLLVYQSPTKVELRVFPVLQNETRQVEIDFMFPETFAPVLQLGDRAVTLGPESPKLSPVPAFSGRAVLLSDAAIRQLPRMQRQPYLHFILDRSMNAVVPTASYRMMIKRIRDQYPQAHHARVSAANFEMQSLTSGFIDVNDTGRVESALERVSLPLRGSLDLQRTLQNAILDYKDRCLEAPDSVCWQEYPVFVILSGAKAQMMPVSDGLEPLARYLPESADFWVVSPGLSLEHQPMWKMASGSGEEVVALRQGRRVAVVSSTATGFFEQGEGRLWEVFDPASGTFRAVENGITLDADPVYSPGLELSRLNEEALMSLAVMDREKAALVSRSKTLGVLIPSTSYMVVERAAQWRALEEREKQKMKASAAFEFDETGDTLPPSNGMDSPTPSQWFLLAVVIAWYLWKRQAPAGRPELK